MQTSISSERCVFSSYPRLSKVVSLPKRPQPQRHEGLQRGILGAASLALIWAALWWVLLQVYQHPGWATSLEQPPAVCGAGRIELTGACVLGEEILVTEPGRVGWNVR